MVSIVVPIYNREATLHKCIESILSQTYFDIEIILVDDGSTDRSGTLCKAYQSQDSRIVFLQQENQGVSAARNAGLRLAKGEYISFVDSDDILIPSAIRILMDKTEAGTVDLVATKYMSEQDFSTFSQATSDLEPEEFFNSYEFVVNFLSKSITILNSPCGKLYKLKLLETQQIQFPNDIDYGEDLIFNLDYFFACSHIKVLSNIVYIVSDTQGSLSRRYRPNILASYLIHYHKRRYFFERQNKYDSPAQRALSTATLYYLLVALMQPIKNKNGYNEFRRCLSEFYQHPEIDEILNTAVPYNFVGQFQLFCLKIRFTWLVYLMLQLKGLRYL